MHVAIADGSLLDICSDRLNGMTRTPFGALIVAALASAFAATWPFRGDLAQSVAVTTTVRPLARANSWRLVLDPQSTHANLALLAGDKSDLLVIGDSAGPNGEFLTSGDVAALQARLGRRPRLVLARIDLTEVSMRDVYWDAVWNFARPGWFDAPLCDVRQSYPVKFWNDDWKKIIYSGPGSQLDRVTSLGFDGVYLTGLDRASEIEGAHPSAKSEIIQFITELAAKARSRRQGFIVMVEADHELIADAEIRGTIDGTGLEGPLYGLDGEKRRSAPEIARTYSALRPLQHDGKPVFAVEYAIDEAFINRASFELRRRGIVPGFEVPGSINPRVTGCETQAAHN